MPAGFTFRCRGRRRLGAERWIVVLYAGRIHLSVPEPPAAPGPPPARAPPARAPVTVRGGDDAPGPLMAIRGAGHIGMAGADHWGPVNELILIQCREVSGDM